MRSKRGGGVQKSAGPDERVRNSADFLLVFIVVYEDAKLGYGNYLVTNDNWTIPLANFIFKNLQITFNKFSAMLEWPS